MFPIAALFDIGTKLIDKLIPDPEAKAKAQAELIKLQQEGRLAELNADMNEQNNISERWKADLASDSWLSEKHPPALARCDFCWLLFVCHDVSLWLRRQGVLRKPIRSVGHVDYERVLWWSYA